MKQISRTALGKYWLFGSLFLAIPGEILSGLFAEILPSLQAGLWIVAIIWILIALVNISPKLSNRIIGRIDLCFGLVLLVISVLVIYRLSQQWALGELLTPFFILLSVLGGYSLLGVYFSYGLSHYEEIFTVTRGALKKTLIMSFTIYLVVCVSVFGAVIGLLNVRATNMEAEGAAFRAAHQAEHDAIDTQFHHFSREVEGIQWHYVDEGNATGTVILFLHGLPECWYSWRYIIPLMNQSFRLIALDMKGYGRSDTADLNYDWKVISQEIVALMDDMGIGQFYVVGHDWGSVIGSMLVTEHNERILGFVRMQAPILIEKFDYSNAPQFILFRSARMGTLFMQNAEWFIPNVYSSRMVKPFEGDDKMYFIYEFSRPHVADRVPLYFSNENLEYLPDLFARLCDETWTFPILLLQADKDPAQPKSYFVGLETSCPRVQLQWITNASHFSNLDQPEKVAAAINAFIQ